MMKKSLTPALVIAALGVAAYLIHGPVAQLANYHAFADQRSLAGVPQAMDVLSNLGFLVAGMYGSWRSRRAGLAWQGFFLAVLATSFGSAWYHLAPDDARLLWDRLPIAIACGALLAALLIERGAPAWATPVLILSGAATVGWWAHSGDLGPYLLIQLVPMLLMLRRHRAAVALYAAAKCAELADPSILAYSGFISGHTLKHLLAAAAAICIARQLPSTIFQAWSSGPRAPASP